MGYFSKEIYDRKRDYAYRKSSEGLEKIATHIVAENPKYKNVDLDNEDVEEMINSEIEDLIEELQPLSELSHKRHEIHSTNRSHFMYDSSELSEIGNQYSDECLIDEVNQLNKKYNLLNDKIELIGDVEVSFDTDSDEDILDYYGEDYEGLEEDEIHDKAYDLMFYDWDKIINKWSDSVRKWYGKLNAKFDTDFPS